MAGATESVRSQPARRAFPDEADDDAYFNESDEEEEQVVSVEVDDRPFMSRQPTGGVLREENTPFSALEAVDVGPQPLVRGQQRLPSSPPLARHPSGPASALSTGPDHGPADSAGQKRQRTSGPSTEPS